jgi:hypothetical protein
MDEQKVVAAVKHYEAMRRAQKKYYEKKMDAKGPRRAPGRPRKEVAEGGASKDA